MFIQDGGRVTAPILTILELCVKVCLCTYCTFQTTYIYVCMYILYVYDNACVYARVFVFVCVCVCACVRTCVRVCVCVCTHVDVH